MDVRRSRDAFSFRQHLRAGIEWCHYQFLQRHGIPCQFVLKVGSPHDLGEIATCQDGREWALFWLEDEIAFVHPQTRNSYKWDRQIYASHPEIYLGQSLDNQDQILRGDGP